MVYEHEWMDTYGQSADQDSLKFVTPRHFLILHAKTQWWRWQCHHPRKLPAARSASGTQVKTTSGGTPNPKCDATPDSVRKLSGGLQEPTIGSTEIY